MARLAIGLGLKITISLSCGSTKYKNRKAIEVKLSLINNNVDFKKQK